MLLPASEDFLDSNGLLFMLQVQLALSPLFLSRSRACIYAASYDALQRCTFTFGPHILCAMVGKGIPKCGMHVCSDGEI